MIKMNFINGSRMREIVVNGRIIFFKPEIYGMSPIKINLDKLQDTPQFNELSEEEKKLFEEIKLLNNEEDIANDIKKDFQRSGWRMFNRI